VREPPEAQDCESSRLRVLPRRQRPSFEAPPLARSSSSGSGSRRRRSPLHTKTPLDAPLASGDDGIIGAVIGGGIIFLRE